MLTLFELTFSAATYSNFENHPRLILARDKRPVPRIELHPKTGLPTVAEVDERHDVPSARRAVRPGATAREEVLGVTATELGKPDTRLTSLVSVPIDSFYLASPHDAVVRKTVARSRNETKEEKKARKEAVRNEKQVRRRLAAGALPNYRLTWMPREDPQDRKNGYARGVFRREKDSTQGSVGRTQRKRQKTIGTFQSLLPHTPD